MTDTEVVMSNEGNGCPPPDNASPPKKTNRFFLPDQGPCLAQDDDVLVHRGEDDFPQLGGDS